MELIDRAELIAKLPIIKNDKKVSLIGCIADVVCMISECSTVDAVEVVRCKDCKHWKHFDHLGCTDFVKVCGLANYMIGATGYCLYGERRCE